MSRQWKPQLPGVQPSLPTSDWKQPDHPNQKSPWNQLLSTSVCPGALYSNSDRWRVLVSAFSRVSWSSITVSYPFHSEAGNKNTNDHDVIPNVGRGVRGYIGAQPAAMESYQNVKPTTIESCTASQLPKSNTMSKLYIGTQPLVQSYIGTQPMEPKLPKFHQLYIQIQFRMKSYSKLSIGHQ